MSEARDRDRDGDDDVAPYYTQAELAQVAGVGRSAVSEAVRRGQLRTTPTRGGTPLVAKAEAERWLRERREPGRPPGRAPAPDKPRRGRKGAQRE